MKLLPPILLAFLAHHVLVCATDSGSGGQPSSSGGSTRCQELKGRPSECTSVFRGNLNVFAKDERLSTDTLSLASHLELNVSCKAVLTAWECYYVYTPCHAARGTQLPVCSQQCRELTQSFSGCYSSYEAALRTFNESNGTSLLDELAEFLEELNCTEPDSFQVSVLPVDQEKCATLYVTSNGQGSNKLQEILVLCLLVGAAVCLSVLLLVVLCVVVVCLRRKRRRHSKSRVACSQQPNNVTTLRRLDSPNPSATIDRFPSSEEVNVRSDVQVARMITDRKRRHYVSLYTGSFIPFQHLELRSVIGEGAYGKVSEGVWRDPTTKIEKRVAIKTLRSFSSEQQLNTLFTESRAMRDFDHPNVMKFLGMCFDAPEGYPYIILPFMTNGSLLDYLKKRSSCSGNSASEYPEGLEVEVLFQFCVDVVDGMTYLAQQKFVHRDLAARNCMVSDNHSILIGDFGLAEDLYSRDQKQCEVRLPVKWMPPESLTDGISNERTDMWSYGVTCWEVFSLGRSPYPGIENHEILQHISTGGRLKKPTLCPDILYDIVRGCWQYNPRDRPSFEEMALTLRQYWSNSQPQLTT